MTIRIDHYPAGVYSFTHVSSLTAHDSSSFKRMADEDNHQGTYLTAPTLVQGIAYLSMCPNAEIRPGFPFRTQAMYGRLDKPTSTDGSALVKAVLRGVHLLVQRHKTKSKKLITHANPVPLSG